MRKNKNLKTGMARIGALMVAALLILESFAISLADGSADASEAITNAAGEGFLSSSLDGILKYLRLRDPDPVQNDLSSQIDGDDRSSALPAEDASNNLAESLPDEIDSETADNGLFDFRKLDPSLPEYNPSVQKTSASASPAEKQTLSAASEVVAPSPSVDPNVPNKMQLSGQEYTTDLFSGSAGYSYPLELPAGVNGLEPALAFSYNHNAAFSNGVLGEGWSISENYVYRDINYTRADASDDIFRLRLNGVDIKIVYNASEGKYHTDHESFMSIEKKSGWNNEKGEYWEVREKDGKIYRFGFNPDSELVSNVENYVVRWSLDSVIDIHDNQVLYQYIENPSSEKGTVYLNKITYNSGLTEVKFDYIYNSDYWTSYVYGYEIKQTGVLANVTTIHDNSRVRRYSIEYSYMPSDINTKKFITKIRKFGKDNTELPSTTFSYKGINKGWTTNNNWLVPDGALFQTAEGTDNGVRLVDVDGDGLSDIVRAKDSSNVEYWRNNGNGFESKRTIPTSLSGGFVDSYGLLDLGARFVDLNGDGKTDILQMRTGEFGTAKALINNGTGWNERSFSMPSGLGFIDKRRNQSNCNTPSCPNGLSDGGSSCNEDAVIGNCTRVCNGQTCSSSGSIVRDGAAKEPEWSEYYYAYDEDGDSFIPQSEKCYKFEYTGSPYTDSSDSSECYDLSTTNTGGGSAGKDCVGGNLDAFAGIGFKAWVAESQVLDWLKTVPADGAYGWIGDVDSSEWDYLYLMKYAEDDVPHYYTDYAEWDDLDDAICDEAGTQTINCAPSQQICSNWGTSKCGYGCAGQETTPIIMMGVYARYNTGLENALNDNWNFDCGDEIDDNSYFGYGMYRVTQYDLTPYQIKTYCGYVPFEYKDGGVRAVDVNGDGMTDLVRGTSSDRRTFINNGTGFAEKGEWQIPSEAYFVDSNGKDKGVRFADMNGDGLIDIIKAEDSTIKVWVNTRGGWVYDSSLGIPAEAAFVKSGVDQGITLVDLNGDGRTDIMKPTSPAKTWLRTKNGWVEDYWWLQYYYGGNRVQIADINGDGAVDQLYAPASSYGSKLTWVNNAYGGYLLSGVTNELGGSVNIDYKSISSLDNRGNDSISDLSSAGWVVSSITINNGLGNEEFLSPQYITSTYRYDYSGGMYDSAAKEFRGFALVRETLPDSTMARHYFYQDKIKKGAEYKTEILNRAGTLMKRVEKTFNEQDKGYTVLLLNSTSETMYDSPLSDSRTTMEKYEYDDYGNAARINYFGDIADSRDDKTETREYVYNLAQWIVDKPRRIVILNSSGAIVKEDFYSYDGRAYGQAPTKGDLTKIESRINSSANASMDYEYSSFGNIRTITDSLGHSTGFTYDSTNRFIEKETNALEQETNYVYDPVTGKVTFRTDSNGIVTEYQYDSFGRKTKEILPYDSSSLPTVEIFYKFDGQAPESITVKSKINDSAHYNQTYFYDGLGNVVKIKRPANSGFIDIDVYYDSNLNLKNQTNPHYTSAADYPGGTYSTINRTVEKTSYNYDALGRVTEVINPDNTRERFEYGVRKNTYFDENNNKKEFAFDGLGRITNVTEFNNDGNYKTSYYYDAVDSVLEIKNNAGKSIIYSYNLLGRKTSMDDPDLGAWRYYYDSNGNLVKQVDNKLNIIYLSYDALNRITNKSFAGGETIYEYDMPMIGTLSNIYGISTNVSYGYDSRLRKIAESKVIDSQLFNYNYSYDSMNRLTNKILPNSVRISYAYDSQNELQEITSQRPATPMMYTIFLSEKNSLRAYYADPVSVVRLVRNQAGLITSRIYLNNIVSLFTYSNSMFRLQNISSGEQIQSKSYIYDNVGNVLQIKDAKNGKTEVFTYDKIDRLVKAEKNPSAGIGNQDYSMTYSYDSLGNMIFFKGIGSSINFTYSGKPIHSPTNVNLTGIDVNLPPVIEDRDITAREGDYLNITQALSITDEKPSKLNVRFSAPLDSKGCWDIGYESSGIYDVKIIASDDTYIVSRNITITILNTNRAPRFVSILNSSIKEGETAVIGASVADPDNENAVTDDDNVLNISYGSPFNSSGMWKTGYESSGSYLGEIAVSDGNLTMRTNAAVIVNNTNRPPAISIESGTNTSVDEGQTARIVARITDPDNENAVTNDNNVLTLSYEAPFNSSGMWKTAKGDAGRYTTIVNGSDGEFNVTMTLDVEVLGVLCSQNSECGTDGFAEDLHCLLNGTYKSYVSYICNNPGTSRSSCSSSTREIVQQKCSANQTCLDLQCIDNREYYRILGRVAWLHFNTPTTAGEFRDSSGNLNTARCQGTLCPSPDANGADGTSLRFDGSNDALTIDSSSSLRITNSISIFTWVKTERNSTYENIVSKYSDGIFKNNNIWTISNNGKSNLGCGFKINNKWIVSASQTGSLPKDGLWHLIGCSYDGSSIMGYIDRNKVINYTAKGVISDSSARIVLGGTSTSIFTKDKFRGSLDEFVIYNRSLSQEEVLNL